MIKPPRVRIVDGPPEGIQGEVEDVSADEVERALLEQLAANEDDPWGALWQLAQFYRLSGRIDRAMPYFQRLLDQTDEVDEAAAILLSMGQAAEKAADFELAEWLYRRGLALDAGSVHTRYFLHNNLGYSLVELGRHAEAEPFCRAAIGLTPERANAHKNLGLSLQSQGRHRDAARAFILSMRANPADPRAARHLEQLLATHPEIT
jgi:tetratricopeptide (TPR) repeat protein